MGIAVVALLVSGCSLRHDPEPPTRTGTTTSASPVASIAEVAPITVTSPSDGADVERRFMVKGQGVAFEGTLLWRLVGASGAVATSGYASAGATAQQPFQFSIEAPAAGDYTLTVYRESAASGAATDAVTRHVTVR